MITASAASRSGTPATASRSPARSACMWKVSTWPRSSDAAHTATPPSSSSRPPPTTPCAPQPTSAFDPSRSPTRARPSSVWSRFAAAAKTIARSTGAPPRPSAARPAASAKASTPSSLVASPVAIRVAMAPSSHGAGSAHSQLRLLRRRGGRAGVLPEQLAKPPRRGGCVPAPVVVERDVHGGGVLGHRLGPLLDLIELLVGVLPPEALGHGLSLEVALGIAPVAADVGEVVSRHRVDTRHDRELLPRWSVDGHEGRSVLGEPGEGVLGPLLADPVAVPKLDGHRPRGEALDQRAQLVQLVLARGE